MLHYTHHFPFLHCVTSADATTMPTEPWRQQTSADRRHPNHHAHARILLLLVVARRRAAAARGGRAAAPPPVQREFGGGGGGSVHLRDDADAATVARERSWNSFDHVPW